MSMLDLKTAQDLVAAALAHATATGFKPLGVAVYDARGALKAFAAQDGTSLKRAEIAMAKAQGALAMGVGTRALGKQAAERPHFLAAASHVVGPFMPVAGGVLLKTADGILLGAVGVSGDTSDNDEAAAIAGAEAVGLVADGG